jgi:hypothetical protein
MSDDITLQFGASVEGATAAIDSLKGKIEGFTSPINELSGSLKELGEIVIAAFAIEKIADFAARMAEVGEEVTRTSAMLGVSVKDTQELGFVAEVTGGSAESMARTLERLQVNLQRAKDPTSAQAAALRELGLSAQQMLSVPITEQVGLLADSYKRLKDEGINPTTLGLQLMGRQAAGLTPELEKGRDGINELMKAGEDAGAILTDQTVAALTDLAEHDNIAGASARGLGATIVGVLAPSFSGMVKIFTDVSAAIKKSIDDGGTWKVVFEVVAAAVDLVDISFAVAIATVESFWELTKAAAKDIAALWQATGRVMYDAFTLNFSDMKGAWSDLQTHLQDNAKTMLTNIGGIAKKAADEIRTALGTVEAPDIKANKPPPGPDKDALKAAAEQYSELMKQAQEQASTAIKLADTAFNSTKEHLAAEVKLHEMTQSQETMALLAALDQKRSAQEQAITAEVGAEMAAVQQKLALYAKGTADWQKAENEKTEILQKSIDQRKELEAKYFADRQKIVDQAAENDAKEWKAAGDAVAGALNSQLLKMLQGKETFAQASKQVAADLVLDEIKNQIKLTAEYLADIARRLAAHIAAETGMTAASVGGDAARAASATASGQVSILETIGNAIKSIFASSGQTAAEVTAAVAPESGPAAPAIGAAAGASTLAGGMSFLGGYATGSWGLPDTGFYLGHKDEIVVPSQGGVADEMRSALRGGRGGVGDTHLHVNALDSTDVERFLNDNAHKIGKSLNDWRRRGGHLGLRTAR